MNVGFQSILFPLASSSDLFGVLVFIIVAILSALSKRFGQQPEATESEETPKPDRPIHPTPSHRPTTPTPEPMGSEPKDSPVLTNLETEMRRFLEEVRRVKQSPPPQRSILFPSRLPSPIQPGKPLTKPVQETPETPQPFVPDKVKTLYETHALPLPLEVPSEDTFKSSSEETKTIPHNVLPFSTKSSTNVPSSLQLKLPLAHTLLTSPLGLQQAIVITEILGKPRALNMY